MCKVDDCWQIGFILLHQLSPQMKVAQYSGVEELWLLIVNCLFFCSEGWTKI